MENEFLPIESTVQAGETTFSENFIMAVRVRGDFSDEQLRGALDRLRRRHARLIPGAAMEEDEHAHFHLRILTGCKDRDWVEVAKIELRQRIQGRSGPFARFVLLRSVDFSDLVGTFDHGFSDGMTGVFVMRDILRLLADPTLELPAGSNPPDFSMLIPKAVKENPKIKSRLRLMVSMLRISVFLGHLGKRLFPKARKAKKSLAFQPGDGLPPSLRFCILTANLTATQTAALVARCKGERTSVHAALCTAWLRAFSNIVEGRKSWNRSVSSPVSLRERMSQPVDEKAGMYMSGVVTKVNCSPERGFWEIAREFKERFLRDSTDEKVFMTPMMIGTFFSILKEDEIEAMIGKFFNGPVKYDFSITNLGRLDIPVEIGPIQVERFYNLVNSSEHERTVGVNTQGGKMTFTYTFRESKMEPLTGEKLINAAMEQLAKAVNW